MKFYKKGIFKAIFGTLGETFTQFSKDNAMKMSASLAYYAVFSIAPLLLIIVWLIGFFYTELLAGQYEVEAKVFGELAALFGEETAKQIQGLMRNISISNKSNLGIVIGVGVLIVGSTKIFVELQDSLNRIWGIRPKPQKDWLKMLINRVISFSMVLGLGLLLLVSLMANGIVAAIGVQIGNYFPQISVAMVKWVNIGLTFTIITTLFAFIFRFLPDARVRFKNLVVGALFTAGLFMLGRYLIALYMKYSAPASAYGAAGTIIILLLWVYYSAAILYFGAEFTKVYARRYDNGIRPAPNAVKVAFREVELKSEST